MELITEPTDRRADLDVDANAPVVASTAIEIMAPADVVWAVLADIGQWPSWNRAVASVSIDGDIAPGTEFEWKAGPGKIRSTLLQVQAPTFIAWSGQTLGLRAIHVFALHADGERTTVRTEESYSGLVARLLRVPLRRSLATALADGLVDLKAEAGRRGSRHEGPSRGFAPTLRAKERSR
jgi:uncharacterized membrane protein